MQKTLKKSISILLSILMVVSLFTALPLTAYAATYESGSVSISKLTEGDILKSGVTVTAVDGSYGFRVFINTDEVISEPVQSYTTDKNYSVITAMDTDDGGDNWIIDLKPIAHTHTVTWKNWDDTTLETDTDVAEGTTPTYDGADPEKAADENYTYTFAGWSPEITAVTGDVTYTAQFTAVPKPAPGPKTVDLSTLSGDYEAQDGDILTGTLAGQYKITVADGATVTLKNATITCLSSDTHYDGIALLGDATILLEGENTVKGGYKYNAGIFVPEEKTLTIDGTGSLNVSSGGAVSAIGAKRSGQVTGIPGGNIVINGGTINANGGNGGAGIGGCTVTNCGTITINGGNVTAVGNDSAPGIGSGNRASYCAGITISGGTVTATGNGRAAGIGCGYSGSCGNITIADTVTKVTATKGNDAPCSIGPGSGGYSCGTITIGGEVTGDIAESPYVYPTYTVTWKNGDTVLETDTDVVNGSIPTYNGATPTKAADGDHMYVFSGWTPEITAVTGDVTYTATFTSSADLVEITDHETELADLGLDNDMSEWGRSMTAQEAITLAQYLSAQNDGANCAVLYEVVENYELEYAMSDGTTGSHTSFYYSPLNDFLPDYKVYYLPVNLNPETIELNLNQDNATVNWDDSTGEYGYWAIDAIYDGKRLVLYGENNEQAAGTYECADMKEAGTPGITDAETYETIVRFINGSCTVTVDEDVVTVSGTFTGVDRNTYVVTVTHEAPYYTITDESVNGAVTAVVNGADVTRAKAGKTVLLNVAPADGYRFKSITASAPKDEAENFSDLVALMGDAVFDGDENYDCGGYTCKVENGKFVVYNGTTLVTELSESNMTGFNGDNDYCVKVNSDNVVWNFYVENGEITGIDVMDADSEYDAIFSAVSGSKSTGTLPLAELALTTVTEGSQYSFTMPKNPVTVTAEFEEAPATYTVTWKNGDTVLETDTGVAAGSTPTYNGETPYKADGADCIYTFSGWTPEVSAVTGDATYTATFTESEKPETIKDCTNKYGDFRLYANVPLVSFSNVNDLLTGAIIPITYGDSNTMIPVQDAKGYSYKFYDQTGTEIPAQITDSSSEPGSERGLSDDVTVYTNVINFTRPAGCTAIYIVATEPTPAPAKLILNVGENGKVVMNNGTFGNATDASNITEISIPGNVIDGSKLIIADGHSANLVEGGSINIATGGEVSFYPSADNTGKITAIPNEGYICTGWYNGDTRYTTKDTIDYQEISEDMTLTAKFAPKLFTGHSVTLGGDIGVNFFLNPAVLDTYTGTKTVKFTCDGEETTVAVPANKTTNGYMVTCNVVAARMAHEIKAVVYVDGTALDQTDSYSVQDYAKAVYDEPGKYLPSDEAYKAPALKNLAAALLHYGSEAQDVFGEMYLNDKTPKRADEDEHIAAPTYYNDTVSDVLTTLNNNPNNSGKEVDDLDTVANRLRNRFFTDSLIYLSKNTLRIYFIPKVGETMPNSGAYDGHQNDYYYYVQKTNIAAAELDDVQKFKVGNVEFYYSPLHYVIDVLQKSTDSKQIRLAQSLHAYNQAANAYFGN